MKWKHEVSMSSVGLLQEPYESQGSPVSTLLHAHSS